MSFDHGYNDLAKMRHEFNRMMSQNNPFRGMFAEGILTRPKPRVRVKTIKRGTVWPEFRNPTYVLYTDEDTRICVEWINAEFCLKHGVKLFPSSNW